MSTPGDLKVVSKGTDQLVPPAGSVDGGTLLRFRDADQSIDTDRFVLPIGRTGFDLQLQAVFATTPVSARPTWVQVELCRIKKVSGAWVYDTTGKARRSVVQPGTTTWADTFHVPEFVNEDDGEFGWTVTHNAPGSIRVEVNDFNAYCPNANQVHKLGGFNRWSDGSIH